jgi:hypothetical protein
MMRISSRRAMTAGQRVCCTLTNPWRQTHALHPKFQTSHARHSKPATPHAVPPSQPPTHPRQQPHQRTVPSGSGRRRPDNRRLATLPRTAAPQRDRAASPSPLLSTRILTGLGLEPPRGGAAFRRRHGPQGPTRRAGRKLTLNDSDPRLASMAWPVVRVMPATASESQRPPTPSFGPHPRAGGRHSRGRSRPAGPITGSSGRPTRAGL